jgi:hypothetical protein
MGSLDGFMGKFGGAAGRFSADKKVAERLAAAKRKEDQEVAALAAAV